MTQQQTTQPICCKQKTISKKDAVGNTWLKCEVCGKTSKGETPETAAKNFGKVASVKAAPAAASGQIEQITTLPTKTNIKQWALANLEDLKKSSAVFVNAPFTKRMIERNINYVMNADLKDCWNTPGGQSSIVEALKKSLWYGSVLPEMGSIVPFGKDKKAAAVFMPGKETFDFALTTGKNALLKWIRADAIYENDLGEPPHRKNGEFIFETVTARGDRGELQSIVVYYYDNRAGMVFGETYSKQELLAKAAKHSNGYQYYLRDVERFEELRTEGKTNFENGREFYIKDLVGKNGTYPKKIFLDELTHGYIDADQAKWLKKLAIKSELDGYMDIVNSVEMAAESRNASGDQIEQTTEQMFDEALNVAAQQVAPNPEQNIKDAEFHLDTTEPVLEDGELFDPNSIEY